MHNFRHLGAYLKLFAYLGDYLVLLSFFAQQTVFFLVEDVLVFSVTLMLVGFQSFTKS
jgi:hypothetical protein